jgi:hypothetical protein
MALTAYKPTNTARLVPTLLAASLSAACASRQYAYGFETAAVVSSGKAVIANGGVDVTTDNTFSETAFLGSPIYIRHLHLTTVMSATKETSYDGAVSICLKNLLVWKRGNASPPAGIGCGTGIRNLTVDVKSGPQQATTRNGECRTTDCTEANDNDGRRVFKLRLPYKDTKVRIGITEQVR